RLLGGIETVLVEERLLAGLGRRRRALQAGQAVEIVAQLVVALFETIEEAPPPRFVLTVVELEQPSQQFLHSRLLRIRDLSSRESGDEPPRQSRRGPLRRRLELRSARRRHVG